MHVTHMTLRSRGARLAGVLALTATLALAGCGARAPQYGVPGAGQQTSQGAAQDASIQNVASANQDVQGIIAALAATQADASVDYASQENETQP